MKTFLKKEDLQLINGGYLVNKEETPMYNIDFVKAQKHAEYIITFAKLAKGKDFKGKIADSLKEVENATKAVLAKQDKTFINLPNKPSRSINNALKEEALKFINFQEKSNNIAKINSFLTQFNIIDEFEEFGLFFEQEIGKLNKIYTMKEIIKAVTSVIDVLA